MKYEVIIEETLSKTVHIEADSYQDARRKVADMMDNGDITLSENDSIGVVIEPYKE